MSDPLAVLLADGVIDEVCGRLKSGKEADLWLVRHGGRTVAAKVYKARHVRTFRNNAGYKEGRQVRDTRTRRAMERGSRFGQAAAEEAWKAKEADALHTLHAAGIRVPTPVMFYEGVLLMELVVDGHGHPAPRLVDAHVPRDRAAALYADLRAQVIRMLGCDLIHGDLSPYNVLLGCEGPVIIDFPQVVGAAHNSQAESFFRRDLENLRRFFAAFEPALGAAAGDAREIWRAYVRRELAPDFVPTGRPPESAPPARHHPRDRAHPHPGAPRHDRSRRGGGGQRGGTPPPPEPARAEPHVRHASGSAPRHGTDRRHAQPHGSLEQPHGRHAQPHGIDARREQRHAVDRRKTTPSPEVIRVVRPALGSAATSVPLQQRPVPGTHHAGGAQPGPTPHHRRRRRRGEQRR